MIDPTTHRTTSERSYHGATSRPSEGEDYVLYPLPPSRVTTHRTTSERSHHGATSRPSEGEDYVLYPLALWLVIDAHSDDLKRILVLSVQCNLTVAIIMKLMTGLGDHSN